MNRTFTVLLAILGTAPFVFAEQSPDSTTVAVTITVAELIDRPVISGCPNGIESDPPMAPIRPDDYVEVEQPWGNWPNRVRLYWDGRLIVRGGQVTFPFVTRIKLDAAIAHFEKYRSAGFWSLCRNYTKTLGASHSNGAVTTIVWGGRVRSVSDRYDMGPAWLQDLTVALSELIGFNMNSAPSKPIATPIFSSFLDYIGSSPRQSLNEIRNRMGADFNAVDANGWTFLMYATQSIEVGKLQDILREANVNVRSSTGETALMLASSGKNVSPAWIRGLIAAGADVNMQNDAGETALMYAATAFGRYPSDRLSEIISMLRQAGAATGIRDKARLTAFDYFEENSKGVNGELNGAYQRVSQLLR